MRSGQVKGNDDRRKRHPRTTPHAAPADLRRWVRQEFELPPDRERQLVDGIVGLLDEQRRLWEQSKADTIDALLAAFTTRISQLQQTIADHDTTISSITRYFERLVADLRLQASRDPKTQLVTFRHFREHLETHLAIEKRGRWCAVGLVDIRDFKSFNDELGHMTGDRMIARVARLLQDHVRSNDVIALDATEDLHARFGGDEFCFLIPRLDDWSVAKTIADRFRQAVARYDWRGEDERLVDRAVLVDIGVACLLMPFIETRRPRAPQLAEQLLTHADTAMYEAKLHRLEDTTPRLLRLERDVLVPIAPSESSA